MTSESGEVTGRGTFALEALASPPGNEGNVLPPCDLTSPLQAPLAGATPRGSDPPPPTTPVLTAF